MVLAALVLYGFFSRAVGTLPVLRVQPLRIAVYVCALLGVSCYGLLFATSGPRNNSAYVVIASGRRRDTAEIDDYRLDRAAMAPAGKAARG